MTIEEAIKVLEKQFDKLCGNSLHQNAEKIDIEDALWMGIEALRSQKEYEEFKIIWDMYGGEEGIVALYKELERLRAKEKNEPLTLEELREMDGKPVWIVPNDSCPAHWRIWHEYEPYDFDCFKAYRHE